MKRVFYLLVVLFLWSCGDYSQTKTIAQADVLPPKSLVVFQFESIKELQENLQGNSFVKQNLDQGLLTSIQDQFKLLNSINAEFGGLLSLSAIGSDNFAFTFITNTNSTLLKTGLVSAEKTLHYDGVDITELKLNESLFYRAQINNLSLISSSKLTLENTIRSHKNNIPLAASFYKVLKASSNSKTSVFINLSDLAQLHQNLFKTSGQLYQKLGEWAVLDLEIEEGHLMANGVILKGNDQRAFLEILGSEKSAQQSFAEAIPLNTSYFYTFKIGDFKAFQDRRRTHNYTNEIISHPIENYPGHLSVSYQSSQTCVDYMPEDVLGFEEEFLSALEIAKEFRGETIFQLKDLEVFSHFSPLITNFSPKFVTKYKGHFLFSEELNILENTLVNIKNKATLSETDYFELNREALNDTYSLQLGSLNENLKTELANASRQDAKAWLGLSFNQYNLSLLQLDLQDNYTLINAYSQSVINSAKSNLKVNRLKRNEQLSRAPQYFVNWRTRQHDIVYQDQDHVLHLIDSKGREIWKKPLESQIIGAIKTLDIYKNTRLQMAFVTQNRLHVIDKNGNDVGRFPLTFETPITQELQVFDYANSGRYRFVVTQGSSVVMYDKEGKLIKGFNYTAKDKLVFAPTHIRIKAKDYILAQTKQQLNILGRTGEIRVKLNQEFTPSQNSFFKYNDLFMGSTAQSELVMIDPNGNVTLKPQDWFSSHFLVGDNLNYVSLSENQLQINNDIVKLDYGLYKQPQLHQLRDQLFISIVDEQTEQLLLLTQDGELVNGFPIYAKSQINIREVEPGRYEFITQGDAQSILVYEFTY